MVTLSQFGKNESIPVSLQANANKTISILNEIFAAFPNRFRFTSGYRSPARNAAAGGVPNSYHVKALAGDFVPVNGLYSSSEMAGIAAIVGKHGFEVMTHDKGSGKHYHIEPMPEKINENSPEMSGANNNGMILIFGLFLYILFKD